MSTAIPDGYAVAQTNDGRWYPLEAVRLYGPGLPEEGILNFCSFGSAGFVLRREAILAAQMEAEGQSESEQRHWERLARRAESRPDHCSHYRAVLEELTGRAPLELVTNEEAMIKVSLPPCWQCGIYHFTSLFSAPTLDEALRSAAESVYEQMNTPCQHARRSRGVASHQTWIA